MGLTLVDVGAAVVVVVVKSLSRPRSSGDRQYNRVSSRKTTPKTTAPIRRRSPGRVGYALVIEPTVTHQDTTGKSGEVSGHLEAKASRGPRLLHRLAQPRNRFTSIGSAALGPDPPAH